MTDEVEEAIQELKDVYGEQNVSATPDQQGGAYVFVQNLDIGGKYTPSIIWCGFYLTHMYPTPDVYPHFVNPDLQRADRTPLSSTFQKVQWQNRDAIQVSRRSNHWNPSLDTAQLKLEKVLKWMKEQ